MYSQLASALLGQSAGGREPEEADEALEDADELSVDEEFEAERAAGGTGGKAGLGGASGRTVTLQMLLSAGILSPGTGSMSIEYLGQKFIGDLLPDGKIRSQETAIVFASPSAWAIHCKRIINPEKKSGCGWASVKYRGRKLDAYKNAWHRQRSLKLQLEDSTHADDMSEEDMLMAMMEGAAEMALKPPPPPPPTHRIVVKHNTVANRAITHDANTMVECMPFSLMGKIQPFLVSVATNALLLMDFHCHLSWTEVCGYLAGNWDVNSHTLNITHAFPCRNSISDRDAAPQVELDIGRTIEQLGLTLAGWYHSHPRTAAAPTLRDIDAQLEHQIRMKGASEATYTPCVAFICSPYSSDALESALACYWVIPPPEGKPLEYGRPALMTYTPSPSASLCSHTLGELRLCGAYYARDACFVRFEERHSAGATYLQKLRASLAAKMPTSGGGASSPWAAVRAALPCDPDAEDALPAGSGSSSSGGCAATSGASEDLGRDLAGVLLQAGKLSLLGLPDPLAQSTLAANAMFLSPSLYKMQEHLGLLKPLQQQQQQHKGSRRRSARAAEEASTPDEAEQH